MNYDINPYLPEEYYIELTHYYEEKIIKDVKNEKHIRVYYSDYCIELFNKLNIEYKVYFIKLPSGKQQRIIETIGIKE